MPVNDASNSVFFIGSGETAYGYIDPNSFTTDIDYYRLMPLLGNLNATGLAGTLHWRQLGFLYSSITPSEISIFVNGILYNNINVKFITSAQLKSQAVIGDAFAFSGAEYAVTFETLAVNSLRLKTI